LALRAGLDRGAGLGPVAAASLADAHGLEGDLPLLILEHVLELDLDDRPDVRARRRAPAEPSERVARPEERIEDVLEAAEARGRIESVGPQALVTETVVGAAALGVGEHLIGLGRLLELLLGRRVVCVDVRMKLASETAERLLDLAVGCVPLDAQHL